MENVQLISFLTIQIKFALLIVMLVVKQTNALQLEEAEVVMIGCALTERPTQIMLVTNLTVHQLVLETVNDVTEKGLENVISTCVIPDTYGLMNQHVQPVHQTVINAILTELENAMLDLADQGTQGKAIRHVVLVAHNAKFATRWEKEIATEICAMMDMSMTVVPVPASNVTLIVKAMNAMPLVDSLVNVMITNAKQISF